MTTKTLLSQRTGAFISTKDGVTSPLAVNTKDHGLMVLAVGRWFRCLLFVKRNCNRKFSD